MYVCICNSVTDREIRATVKAGAGSFREVQSLLGVATCCGRCADCARSVIRDTLGRREAAEAAVGDD